MGGTCVASIIVINTTINQVETNTSLITISCLKLFVVAYKHEML